MRYSNEVKEKAFDYFCMGLKSHEIGKLMDLGFRTIQEFSRVYDWKERRNDHRLKEEKRIIRKYRKEQRQMERTKAEN